MQTGDAHGDAEVLGNLLRQRRMGASRKQFELAVDHALSRGARRFARAQYPSDLPLTSDL
jgi:hypothetical protein